MSMLQVDFVEVPFWPQNVEEEMRLWKLIKADADVNATEGDYRSALQAAVAQGHAAGCKDLIRLLMGNPVVLNLQSRDSHSSRLLHAAIRSGELDTLNDLLKVGAEKLVNVKNLSNQTPIEPAVKLRNVQVLDTLYSFSKEAF